MGANAQLLEMASESYIVTSAVGATGPELSGGNITVKVAATCEHAMIAPSPDWIVQIGNMPLVRRGRFIEKRIGRLHAFDCGTDDSGDFTPPSFLPRLRKTLHRYSRTRQIPLDLILSAITFND